MRSAVVLLGFLLASAQAFYIPAQTRTAVPGSSQPSFLGQTVAHRAPSARATLVASLDDIEAKILAAEKAKIDAQKGAKTPASKAPASKAPAPAPKAAAPAIAPKPAASKVVTKTAVVAPAPAPAPKPVVAPAPTPASSSSIKQGELAEGVALGALPWVVAPVAALAALRPLLAKSAAVRDEESKKKAAEDAAKAKAAALAEQMEGLTDDESGRVKALAGVASVCLGGLLAQPLLAPPDLSAPAPTVQTQKAATPAPKKEPAPAPAPAVTPAPEPKPAPAPAPAPTPEPKPAPAPAPAPAPEPKPAPAPAPAPAPEPKPAPAPAPKPASKKSKKEEPAAPAYAGPSSGRVLEAETLSPDVLNMLKSTKKK